MRWFFLGLATAVQAAVSMVRLGVPAVMPLLKQELALDSVQVGLTSSVLNGGAALAGIPSGRVVDRVGERLVIGYGAIACGAAVLGVLAAPSFGPMLGVLLVTGFLSAVSVPAGGVLVSRWFSRHERGTAMGIRQTGVPLGGALAALLLPPLALAAGWRPALGAAGLSAVLIGILALFWYRDATDVRASVELPTPGLRALLARRSILALTLFAFTFGGAQWCLLTYLVLHLTESLGADVLWASSLLALTQIAGVAGRVGWGLVSDRLLDGRRTPALGLIGLIAIGTTVALALASDQTPGWLIALEVTVLGATLLGWNGLPHILAPELAGPRQAGLAVGIINSAGFVGVIILPPLFGSLVETTLGYRGAWLALPIVLLVGLAGLPLVRPEERTLRAQS